MGLPIARIIDRGNRPVIIAVGIAVWSVATAASGLATEYWHLLAARTGVAVGEAVLIPGAVSLLADLFSADKRGRAMGIFGAGAPVGAGVGLLAGGLLLGYFTAVLGGAAVRGRAPALAGDLRRGRPARRRHRAPDALRARAAPDRRRSRTCRPRRPGRR